ncbi:response regulator [Stappia sp.]|jgi:CheY-like chemotaxis protein|uniref:response regulator n=1 Tax=Stappia sp. TaxID=1870903 RepID=UPI003A993D1A
MIRARTLKSRQSIAPAGKTDGKTVVLVIDDDPDDLFLLSRALRDAFVDAGGFSLATCVSPLEAVARMDEAGVPVPDLVLIDLNMPGLSGIELVAHLRRRPAFDAVPLIVITTGAEAHLREEARAAGADAVIAKPDTLSGLTKLAASIRNDWLTGRGTAPLHPLSA